jgi:site-specific DNA-cytosine methylase
MSKQPCFVSLFSGCGGLDMGFIQAGFNGVAAFDFDPTAVETYSRNFKILLKAAQNHYLLHSITDAGKRLSWERSEE